MLRYVWVGFKSDLKLLKQGIFGKVAVTNRLTLGSNQLVPFEKIIFLDRSIGAIDKSPSAIDWSL